MYDKYRNNKNVYNLLKIGHIRGGAKWTCSACTFENVSGHSKCDICTTQRPNATDTTTKSGLESKSVSEADEDKWICSVCTYQNNHTRVCEICYSLRPTLCDSHGAYPATPTQVLCDISNDILTEIQRTGTDIISYTCPKILDDVAISVSGYIKAITKVPPDNGYNLCFLSAGSGMAELYIVNYLLKKNVKINELIMCDSMYENETPLRTSLNKFLIAIKKKYPTFKYTLLNSNNQLIKNRYDLINKKIKEIPEKSRDNIINDVKIDAVLSIHYQNSVRQINWNNPVESFIKSTRNILDILHMYKLLEKISPNIIPKDINAYYNKMKGNDFSCSKLYNNHITDPNVSNELELFHIPLLQIDIEGINVNMEYIKNISKHNEFIKIQYDLLLTEYNLLNIKK
jgi:hypothetical protein